MELGIRERVIIFPVVISVAIIITSILIIGDAAVIGNMFIISMFVAVIPYFLYRYSKYAWLKGIERQFPNFIRDLADSKRSGMTLETSINMTAKTNYGKLTSEIKTMSNKLSWGVPFLRVIDIFEKKVSDSTAITEVLNILKEVYKSGGNVIATLDSAAANMNMLREAEEERRSVTSQHVMVTYGIFLLFLGIVIVIIYIFVPMMTTVSIGGEFEVSDPFATSFMNPCSGFEIAFPCGLFAATCTMLDVDPVEVSCYYVSLFFFVLVIQGLSSGLIAGQLGENSAVAGAKHSMIMASVAIFVFILLAKIGVFPT
ncbi:MAG: type II secretion system F family protein [Candidatus Aenigmatarchaeota archaeon]|nr:MAG: type II secretion system F family protein [Candidatus Aenigmarchaeota archaeon]